MGDFFIKAKIKHNNKYDYSKVDYINSRTKICIICPEHGEFWQMPSNHLHGCGCPKCKNDKIGNNRRLTLFQFIEKAKQIHGDKYDYSKVEYVNNSTKVCIICTEHGEFWQTPGNHLHGCGCPKCSSLPKKNTNDFIKEAKLIHQNKYNYSKVEYVNAQTKVCIICPEHGEFWQTPHKHLSGQGCPKCGVIKSHIGKSKLIEEFINKAKEIHNDKYDYSKVEYVNTKTKVCIICPEHGEFWQSPHHHLYGHGCPKCKAKVTSKLRCLTKEAFAQKCINIYGNIYDYSKVNYINTYTPVVLTCNKHGDFKKKPIYILQGHGCPKCSMEHYHNVKTNTNNDFIKKANLIHNYKYDYSKTQYIGSKSKVCIVCPEHGEFWQSADKHLMGQGCPKCSISISKNEDVIAKLLKSKTHFEILERVKHIISPYELDIYIPEKRVAIEYNGLIWHSEKFGKDKNYHLMKTELCEKQGIRLIHIFEDEWLEHSDIVKSKLRHILGYDMDLPKIFARKCIIKAIDNQIAKSFLEKNHIQGFARSSVYLGCYHNDEIVGVMTFKREIKNSDKWELTRFASDINKHCIGVGGKLFKYFVKNYNPTEVKSFADRRWSTTLKDNLYIKLGFKLKEILKPEYRYTTGHNGRIHKFNFRKKILLRKYPNSGLTEDMTEYEMTQKLGFYRIWDCGLYKFVWYNDIYNK